MSNNVPVPPDEQLDQLAQPPVPVTGLGAVDLQLDDPEGEGLDWRRYIAALLHFKWLIAGVTVVGSAAGFLATRFIAPEYAAQATIWIQDSDAADNQGPIQSGLLLESFAWVELIKGSFVVLDPVILEQRLYVTTKTPEDAARVASLEIRHDRRPIAGGYSIAVDTTGRYTLSTVSGVMIERGVVGDSIGQRLGLRWAPDAGELPPGSSADFNVEVPRDAARALQDRLIPSLDREGNFLRLELRGTDPVAVATTLDAVAHRYVDVAAELKRERLKFRRQVLEGQLETGATRLTTAEIGLERFRVETITLPNDRATPVNPGLEETRNPVFSAFFDTKIQRENLKRDREDLERALADSGLSQEALVVIAAVRDSPDLAQAIQELTTLRGELRSLRNTYTEEHPEVQRKQRDIDAMLQRSIPALGRALVNDIRVREQQLDARITAMSQELEEIPQRQIEEARLQRAVAIAENLYQNLRSRFEEARLAEESSPPDLQLLDSPVVPRRPIRDDSMRLMMVAFAASLGLGLVGAIVLDRIDRRFRYPDQVTRGLGLTILGAVPHVHLRNGRKTGDTSQVVEALRGIRLNLVHAYGAVGPLVVTVSSPGAGDGKSFLASNLALAFAELGHRTLLIDGDVRRGRLHRVLNGARKPGLTDFLAGRVERDAIIQATSYASLFFLGSGTRMQNGPELLGSVEMPKLLTSLRSSYGVIVVDSPPLGAGVDPFILGTVTGNLLLVLRTGTTDREVAEAKLEVVHRLPIRVLGAVLNDVRATGPYRYYYSAYYSYLPGYEATNEDGDSKALEPVR